MITGLLILVYIFLIAYLAVNVSVQSPEPAVPVSLSIIIPARDEEAHIAGCLESIAQQAYDLSRVEVILVDDASTDRTTEVAGAFENRLRLKIIKSTGTGKKQALMQGIESASSDIIITTDADCRAGKLWLTTMVNMFQSRDLDMLCGPVEFSSSGWFEQLQKSESAAIVGMSAVMLNNGMPATCNGANLMFRKDVFMELGGYDWHTHIMSGDDDLLMQRFFKNNRHKVSYLLHKDALVTTKPAANLRALLQQRKRWLSKRHAYLYPYNERIQLLVVLHLIAFYYLLCVSSLDLYFPHSLILVGLKYMVDFIYGIRLRKVFSFRLYTILFMPFYQLYMALLPFYNKPVRWKGREVN